jgi:hypothetical protein
VDLNLTFEGDGLSGEAQHEFTLVAEAVFRIYRRLIEPLGVDHLEVECVLAEDFVAAVNARAHGFGDADHPGFTADRVGGMVVAKNLAQEADESRVAIVFSADIWVRQYADRPMEKWALMAHEIAHPVMSRVRWLSGSLHGVPFPSHTPTEVMRTGARIDWDEFRAEALADVILQESVAMTHPNLDPQDVSLAKIAVPATLAQVRIELTAVYPRWADRVQTYREGRLALTDLWIQTARELAQLRTLIARMTGGMGIDSDELLPAAVTELPAYRLYFSHPWEEFIKTLRESPLLTRVDEHRDVEERILAIAEQSFRAALAKLGLEAHDHPDRSFEINVNGPQRLD